VFLWADEIANVEISNVVTSVSERGRPGRKISTSEIFSTALNFSIAEISTGMIGESFAVA
jgi:hypothetical protein